MKRPPVRRVVLPFVAILVGSCVGGDTPTGLGDGFLLEIPINPALVPSPADADALPINLIRARLLSIPDEALLGQTTQTVNPSADQWDIVVEADIGEEPAQATLYVYLDNVLGNDTTTQFSGLVGPITLEPGVESDAPDVPIYRGPIENAFVTGVAITGAPATLLEGATASLSAQAEPTGSTPTVFWTALDPTILSTGGTAESPTVTGLLPGVGRVAASAGAHADTASIVVLAVPAEVLITPESVQVNVSAQVSFDAAVVDARGDTLSNAVVWRSGSPGIISSLGGGLFVALADGNGVVRALAASDTTVVGTAQMIVGDVSIPDVDVAVLKTVDEPRPPAGSPVVFTVSVVNNGTVPATDVAVFDELDPIFTSPAHTLSSGSLVGDSLWVLPSLGAGQTATWTTTAVVSPDAVGASASNTATLRSLAENDVTPDDNSATVSLTIFLSATPTVQITSPADGAVFDPGTLVTFEATATDPEDGDLAASLQWASNLDGALGTGAAIETDALSTGVHTVTATVLDSDDGVGADTVEVTVAFISTPATLNVPFGGTASLPITLTEPAPSGGVTLTVTSDDQSVVEPTVSTVTIPGGSLSANATLSGVAPGTATVTVANPFFGSSATAVSVTAALNILQTALTVPQTLPQTIDIRLESAGTPIPAPPGGLEVSLTARDAACVDAPATVTIAAGLTSQSATLSAAGTTPPPCAAWVVAEAPSVDADSVDVDVTAAPPIFVSTQATVGAGLQYGQYVATLGSASHDGVTLRIESDDPSLVLVSPDASTPGTDFIEVTLAPGFASAGYWIQGVEGAAGTTSLTVSAPGFTGNSDAAVTVAPPAFDLLGLAGATTPASPSDDFQIYLGVANPQGTGLAIEQAVRAGGTAVTATVSSDTPAVVDVLTSSDDTSPVTVVIQPGQSRSPLGLTAGGVAAIPLQGGTAAVSATIAGYAGATGTRTVTVSAPTISVGSTTVGAGLQYGQFNASLSASAHGGVTVTVASSDPSIMLVAPNGTTPGTASITVTVPDGSAVAPYWVQGVEGQTGVANLEVSAPGFTANNDATVTVVEPGINFLALNPSQTTLSPDDPFLVYVGAPNPAQNGIGIEQGVRAGGQDVVATVVSDNPDVAQLVTANGAGTEVTVTIPPGQSRSPTTVTAGGIALDPLSAGTATIGAQADGFLPSTGSTVVTVTAPTISVSSTTVGAGLQYGTFSVVLGASQHGGVTVQIASADPAVMLVSPDAATPGAESFEVVVPNGQTLATYFVHGVEGAAGAVPLIVSAPGFVTSQEATVTVVQPGFDLIGLTSSQTTFSPDDPFQVRLGVPNQARTGLALEQGLRAGAQALTFRLTSEVAGVGLLTTQQSTASAVSIQIAAGASRSAGSVDQGGVAFDAQGAGSTTVAADLGTAFLPSPGFVDVTVTQPTLTVSTATVGSGLQYGTFGVTLGASQHGDATVRIESSNPEVLLVSPNAQTEGSAFIDVAVPNGQTFASYWIHGVEGAIGEAVLKASASGFTDGSAPISVVQPALAVLGLNLTQSAGGANDPFFAYTGVPNANRTGLALFQAVSVGRSALGVTLGNSNAEAAQLVTTEVTGQTVTVFVSPGATQSPSTVAQGGVAFDPLSPGITSVRATASGFLSTASPTVTINP